MILQAYNVVIDLTLSTWATDVVSDNTKRYLLITTIFSVDKSPSDTGYEKPSQKPSL